MSNLSPTFHKNRNQRQQNAPVQINMAPLIDFLVITIAYFLISASYCSVGLIDSSFQASQGSGGGGGNSEIKKEIEITVKSDHSLMVKESQNLIGVSMTSEKLITFLSESQNQNDLENVSLNAESGISFDEVMRTFNQVRRVVPTLSLNVDSL